MVGTLSELPRLREELRLLRAGPSLSGAPAWVIHDPATNKYFHLNFEMFQILSLWNKSGTAEKLLENLAIRFGRVADPSEIEAALHIISTSQLAQSSASTDWRGLHATASRRQAWYVRAFHSYLFFKLPLFRPQKFLEATWPFVRFVFSRPFVFFVMCLGFVGLYFVSRQWDSFINTVPFFFTPEGALISILAVVFVKSLHELGHGYMAYRYGCHIPTMGLAFMAFVPMLYTDITDSWKLKSSRQRLMIDSAGIQVELALSMVCLFLWSFLPDGGWRSAAFITATVSWIMSLMINLNPLMRFDGYFILSDLLGLSNLHERTFAHFRFRLRRLFFATHEEPIERFSPALDAGLVLFAFATAIYRLSLYLGIAILVYHFFIKIVGIFLFLGEIFFFIVQPTWKELKVWWSMRNPILKRPNTYATILVFAVGIYAFFLPISTSVDAPALSEPENIQRLFSEAPGKIIAINAVSGQIVHKGDILFVINSPGLAFERRSTEADINLRELRLSRITADAEDLNQRQILQEELASLNTKMKGLQNTEAELAIRAEFEGQLADISNRIYVGKWVSRTEQLGIVFGGINTVSRGFVAGDDLPRVSEGVSAKFIPDDLTEVSQEFALHTISTSSSDRIDLAALASVNGGRIAVNASTKNDLLPVSAQYGVKAIARDSSGTPNCIQRGVLKITARSESMATRVWRQILKVVIRESGA